MNSFNYIISTLNLPKDMSNISNIDFSLFGFINLLKYNNSKFEILKSYILNNVFIEISKQKELFEIFCQSQFIYRSFSNLSKIFKLKKANVFNNSYDLYFNDLKDLNKSIVIKLYDSNNKILYYFRKSDLLTIIMECLLYSPDFFCEPKPIKNPYTNEIFSKSQLYNIYFSIKDSPYIVPPLFTNFFLVDFDLKLFQENNEAYIRDIALKNYLKTASRQSKINYILMMLKDNKRYLKGLEIHPDFPSNTLLAIFETYLQEYLLSKYSLNNIQRENNKFLIMEKLITFRKLNPTFGRKLYNIMGGNNVPRSVFIETVNHPYPHNNFNYRNRFGRTSRRRRQPRSIVGTNSSIDSTEFNNDSEWDSDLELNINNIQNEPISNPTEADINNEIPSLPQENNYNLYSININTNNDNFIDQELYHFGIPTDPWGNAERE